MTRVEGTTILLLGGKNRLDEKCSTTPVSLPVMSVRYFLHKKSEIFLVFFPEMKSNINTRVEGKNKTQIL